MPQNHCKASPNLGLLPRASLVTMVTVSLVLLAVQSAVRCMECAVPCWNDALPLKTSSLSKSKLAFPVPLHYRGERISQMLFQKLMLPCKQHNPHNLLLDWLEDEKRSIIMMAKAISYFILLSQQSIIVCFSKNGLTTERICTEMIAVSCLPQACAFMALAVNTPRWQWPVAPDCLVSEGQGRRGKLWWPRRVHTGPTQAPALRASRGHK